MATFTFGWSFTRQCQSYVCRDQLEYIPLLNKWGKSLRNYADI